MDRNRKACNGLLEQLRAVDFAIVETTLYLDAYPECHEALCHYHKLVDKREALMQNYEHNCGPLSMYGNRDRDSWDWTNAPWPWEIDAN